jgi:hypothetical protein
VNCSVYSATCTAALRASSGWPTRPWLSRSCSTAPPRGTPLHRGKQDQTRARPQTRPPLCVRAAHSGAEQNAAAKCETAAQVQRPDLLRKVSRRGHGHGRDDAHHHRAHHAKLERRAPTHPPKSAH